MESHGTPGRIQITRATYELLADEFEYEPRGAIAVKGKGEVEAWYLIGLRGDRAAGATDRARDQTLTDRGHAWTSRNA
jgi:class 3 adenylate cyclase